MKVKIIIIMEIALLFSSCFTDSKNDYPIVTCQIVCDSLHFLPKSNIEYAIASMDITIANKPKYPNTGSFSDVYEHIFVIPQDTRAIINGKTYYISVKKKFEKILGKKVLKLPSTHIGRPDNIEKAELYKITASDTDLIADIFQILHKNKVFYNSFFEDAINILQNPNKNANLRTYNVRHIYVTEYYIRNNQTVSVNAVIEGDTLLLLY